MTEVCNCGGGHCTRLKDQLDQLVCLWGAPSPVYKGVEEGEGRPSMARPGGVLLPPGVGFPPSLVGLGEKEGGEREEGKGGIPHPIRIGLGGCTLHLVLLLLSPTMAQ